jgi:hypothetical protein
MRRRPFFLLAALLACNAPAFAAPSLTFQPIDPTATSLRAEVFVRDPSAASQTDDRGPINAPGFRRVGPSDDPNAELFDADGAPLLFTLDKWRAANGTADISSGPAETKVVMNFRRLIAFGRYSLFVRLTGDDGVRYTPLDGKGGQLNSFGADQAGLASVTVYSPGPLPSGAQIVVVYHSDATEHGASPGQFGLTAHQQLILRLP